MLQIFISAKAAAQFRALSPAHISIHRKAQMRMLLNVFDILLCKMAVAHHNHMFLVIPQLAVMPQDSTHTDALCRHKQCGKSKKHKDRKAGKIGKARDI